MGWLVLGLVLVIVLIASVFVVSPVIAPQTKITINVVPGSLRGDAIAGQHVVYLVTLGNATALQNQQVRISAQATNSSIFVEPEMISSGQVSEVSVIPDVSSVGHNVTVIITARESIGASKILSSRTLNFTVMPGENGVSDKASQIRDTFVQWIEINHPELGITNQTQWVGTIVSPIWLVVTHYLFFSKNWEMHVYWHVMIPPYDWARIDLRQRFVSTIPTFSFEISSLNATMVPHPITPPDSTWR